MMTSVFLIADHTSAASAPRQYASSLARSLGFDGTRAGQAALVASELATNIAKHAGSGQVLINQRRGGEAAALEIVAVDKGPGLPTGAIRDGYSTAGSLGAGLGAVGRLADDFQVFTQPGAGTVVVARIWETRDADERGRVPPVTTLSVPKAGESICGDAVAYRLDRARRAYIVADGLGHGPLAYEASSAAVRVFEERPLLSPAELIEEIHAALRPTRGAAVAVAVVDTASQTMRFAAVGNIVSALVTPDPKRQNLASHNGTAGHAVRRVQEFTYAVRAGAVLVMHTDGLGTRWSPEAYPGVWDRDPALAAGVLYRDHTRGRDDATVLVARVAAP
jgi:anti-sigma regulatory factor (Ser/Thr protein kinase)